MLRFLDAWNDHDVDKVLSFLTEDVVWVEPGGEPGVRQGGRAGERGRHVRCLLQNLDAKIRALLRG